MCKDPLFRRRKNELFELIKIYNSSKETQQPVAAAAQQPAAHQEVVARQGVEENPTPPRLRDTQQQPLPEGGSDELMVNEIYELLRPKGEGRYAYPNAYPISTRSFKKILLEKIYKVTVQEPRQEEEEKQRKEQEKVEQEQWGKQVEESLDRSYQPRRGVPPHSTSRGGSPEGSEAEFKVIESTSDTAGDEKLVGGVATIAHYFKYFNELLKLDKLTDSHDEYIKNWIRIHKTEAIKYLVIGEGIIKDLEMHNVAIKDIRETDFYKSILIILDNGISKLELTDIDINEPKKISLKDITELRIDLQPKDVDSICTKVSRPVPTSTSYNSRSLQRHIWINRGCKELKIYVPKRMNFNIIKEMAENKAHAYTKTQAGNWLELYSEEDISIVYYDKNGTELTSKSDLENDQEVFVGKITK